MGLDGIIDLFLDIGGIDKGKDGSMEGDGKMNEWWKGYTGAWLE